MAKTLIPTLLFLLGCFFLHQTFGGVLLPGIFNGILLGLVFLVSAGAGRTLLRKASSLLLSEGEKTLMGGTLGLGVLCYSVFLLGVLGWLYAWVISAFLIFLGAVCYPEIKELLRGWREAGVFIKTHALAMGGIFLLSAVCFWMSWIPPHQYDSLVYHLALPEHYVLTRRLAPVPGLMFNYFPQNAEMLYTLSLLFGSDILAQMMMWLAFVLSLAWILVMAQSWVSVPTVLVSGLLLTSHTSVLLLSSTTYVESLVMLWITASFFCFLRYWELPVGAPASRGWLILSALFTGCGLGTKYYAGICFLMLALFLASRLVGIYRRSPKGRRVLGMDLFVFGVSAFLPFFPWLLRNYWEIGNPVFPFLSQWFGGRGWPVETASRYFQILSSEYGHRGHFFKDLFSFPLIFFQNPFRLGGGMDILGSMGWNVFFLLFPWVAWDVWRRRRLVLPFIYCLGHGLLWFCSGVVPRFLLVIVPLLSLLTAQSLTLLWGELRGGAKTLLLLGLGLFFVHHELLFLHVQENFQGQRVLLGMETREEYLGRRLYYYPCARYARENLPQEAKILSVGEQRIYYSGRETVPTTTFSPNPFVEQANHSRNWKELGAYLKNEKFTHILYVPQESERLSGYEAFRFTKRGLENWADLQSNGLEPVFQSLGCVIYAL